MRKRAILVSRRVLLLSTVLVVVCSFGGDALQADSSDPWKAWEFLAGKWSAAGGGTPGQGTGLLSFEFDLQQHVLIRKNHVDYPATKERGAFAHDDLMITYKEPGSDRFLADYWDNEGHVIHYTVAVLNNGTIQFVSLPAPGPAFRVTYAKASVDEIKIRFEIAPPDRPGEFKVYAEGTARRLTS